MAQFIFPVSENTKVKMGGRAGGTDLVVIKQIPSSDTLSYK